MGLVVYGAAAMVSDTSQQHVEMDRLHWKPYIWLSLNVFSCKNHLQTSAFPHGNSEWVSLDILYRSVLKSSLRCLHSTL